MPNRISGQRIARSFVSPTGATNEVTRVLDFQLAADQGIEISAVLGYGHIHDDSPAVSDTVPISVMGHQTLHLEAGNTEDLPSAAGEDADEIDTEILWMMPLVTHYVLGTTNTFGGGVGVGTSHVFNTFPIPILSPRNITHKGFTPAADQDGEYGVLIYYHYVSFSSSELGVLLSRR